ncbi:helix-turn-helix transcriptional regulator [Maribacter algarum]|uniref:Helix-turn-helix transcriptional regulator n=1 Tax=Maribacter algarum (ex Zhang et al. 2020) TaxID=2578118 RepID=A0A5S3PZQ1_9FLAO|nr:AraC family transcriptional regulator [Maribacter algarum]TMM58807.1 helix-turn-helix transcriptional regulator [Maribacter algarum]
MEVKNVAQGSFQEVLIEEGFYVLKIQNDTSHIQKVSRAIDSSFIQFHFCLKGNAKFVFNDGRYALEVSEENSLLLYNTQMDLPLNLELNPNSWLVSVVMTIRKFHSLFSKEASYIPFLSEENKDKKYYTQEGVSPAIAVVLSQMMNYNLHPSIKELYIKGKVYELISLYFNKGSEADIEQCPFLVDEDNVRRIRQAKEIMISRMAEPPTLTELSEEIGLSLKKLKEGFKQIYGDSVFSFLFDYKMEYARKMLETGQHNVNEVGLKVGYSTASHFIAAFKKKYGTTPKKYLMGLAN